MTNFNISKPLRRGDDVSKELIIEALAGEPTFGFDIDSIYYYQNTKKWVVIEFLKCDHLKVSPNTSHPSRYWNKNWRKFASLWNLVERLSAEFILVNYETQEHAALQGRSEREFHVITVELLNPTEFGGIVREKTRSMNFTEFKTWFQVLNRNGSGGKI